MRVVLDTNVVIDALSDDFSAPAKLLEAIQAGELMALASPKIVREYRLIARRQELTEEESQKIESFIVGLEYVEPQSVDVVIDDPEDYKFLEVASPHADLLVTTDRHLLSVGEIGEMRIVTPQEAWVKVQEEINTGGEWQQWVSGLGIGQ